VNISITQWWQNKISNLYWTLDQNLLKIRARGLILLNPMNTKPTTQSNVLAWGMTQWSPARKPQILLQNLAPSIMDTWAKEFRPHRYERMWLKICNTDNKFSLMKIWNKHWNFLKERCKTKFFSQNHCNRFILRNLDRMNQRHRWVSECYSPSYILFLFECLPLFLTIEKPINS
jgi:hypothetical protein